MKRVISTLMIVFVAGGSLTVRAETLSSASPAAVTSRESRPLDPSVVERHFEQWTRSEPVDRTQRQIMREQRKMGTGTRAMIIAGAAVGGFFGGGALGHKLENTFAPCGCDDPGLKGALIGAPIGAVAGVVTAALLTR